MEWGSLILCFLKIDERSILVAVGFSWKILNQRSRRTIGGFRPVLIVASTMSPLLWIKSSAMHKSRVLFSVLDRVESIFGELGHGNFLLGDTITERNIGSFTTIVKFNITYFNALHCGLKFTQIQSQ
jgi:hypothetical protein